MFVIGGVCFKNKHHPDCADSSLVALNQLIIELQEEIVLNDSIE